MTATILIRGPAPQLYCRGHLPTNHCAASCIRDFRGLFLPLKFPSYPMKYLALQTPTQKFFGLQANLPDPPAPATVGEAPLEPPQPGMMASLAIWFRSGSRAGLWAQWLKWRLALLPVSCATRFLIVKGKYFLSVRLRALTPHKVGRVHRCSPLSWVLYLHNQNEHSLLC